MTKKSCIWLAVLLCLLTSLLASEPSDLKDVETFNPDNPQTFNYESGDYSTITDWSKVDWNQVKWENIPWETTSSNQEFWKSIPVDKIHDIPKDKVNYLLLKEDQRKALTANQIAVNLDKIENLATDVNPDGARVAVNDKTGLFVESFGNGARFEGGLLKSTTGEMDQLDLGEASPEGKYLLKSGWIIKVTEAGEILVSKKILPAKVSLLEENVPVEEKDFSLQDSFTFEGVNVQLSDGRVVHQAKQLSYKEGEYYVPAGKAASVDFYKIGSSANELDELDRYLLEDEIKAGKIQPIKVYFDGKEHSGNYVSLGEKEVFLGSTNKEEVKLAPQPGNEFFSMIKRVYEKDENGKPIKDKFTWEPDERDTLEITVKPGASIQITNRKEDNLIPLVQSTTSDGGSVKIVTGPGSEIEDTAKGVSYDLKSAAWGEFRLMDGNSVPLEFVPADRKSRILITSSNRLAVADYNDANHFYATTEAGLKVTNDLDFNLIKTEDDVAVRFPNLELARVDINTFQMNPANYPVISPNLAQLTIEWLEKNPKASILKGVIFADTYNAANIEDLDDPGYIVIGEKISEEGNLKMTGVREMKTVFEVLNHEMDHMHDTYVKVEERKLKRKDYPTLNEIYTELYGDFGKQLTQEGGFQQFLNEIPSSPTTLSNLKTKKEDIATVLKALGDANADNIKNAANVLQITEEKFRKDILEDRLMSNVAKEILKTEGLAVSGRIVLLEFQETYDKAAPEEKSKVAATFVNEKLPALSFLKIDDTDLKSAVREIIPLKEGEYALRAYALEGGKSYAEMGTVPLEIPPNRAAMSIASGNEFLRKATQVAYDVGKISKVEYKQRMGSYCEIHPNNCGKCIVYKLTCKS